MAQAYHAIHPTDPHVEDARHILGEHLSSTGLSSYLHEAPPLHTGRRGSRRHTATGRPKGRPRDVPVVPERGTYYEEVLRSPVDLGSSDLHTTSGFMMETPPPSSGGAWGSSIGGSSQQQYQMTGDGAWGSWIEGSSQQQSQMTGEGAWGSSIGGSSQQQSQMTGDGAWGGTAQGTSAGGWESWIEGSSQHQSTHVHYQTPITHAGSSQIQTQSQITHAGSSQFQSPTHGFAEFASHSSPWLSPTSHSADEHGGDVPQRQQPERQVKGRGRRCFTGSHVLPH